MIDPTVDVAELAAQIHQWLGESDIDSPDRRRLLELARQALDAGRIVCLSCVGATVACGSGTVGSSASQSLPVTGSYPVRSWLESQPRVTGGDLTGSPLMTAPDCLRGRD
jgi:putative intracellular protease/amidase